MSLHQTQEDTGYHLYPSEMRSSLQWLQSCGLQSCGLTLSHLLSVTAVTTRDGDGTQSLKQELWGFEDRLHQAVDLYHRRISQLEEGSLQVFGLVTGSTVAVLIDTRESGSSAGRLSGLQRNLLCLLEEQLCTHRHLCLLSTGSEPMLLWDGNQDEKLVRRWVCGLEASRVCDPRRAVLQTLAFTNARSLLVVVGGCPYRHTEVLLCELEQCIVGRDILLHIVAYETRCSRTVEAARRLVEATAGRFHHYSNGQVVTSTDLQLLWRETDSATELLRHVQEFSRDDLDLGQTQGKGTSRATARCSKYVPLCMKSSRSPVLTPAQWLARHGLGAEERRLYHEGAKRASTRREGIVPALAQLHRVQRRLEKRQEWLNSGSRRVWGSLCEESVCVLLDMSLMNAPLLEQLQGCVRSLLEEQTADKLLVILTAFGTRAQHWSGRSAFPDSLQCAWRWLLGLTCSGSRNVAGAVRSAVHLLQKMKATGTLGLYLLTTGTPDQDMDAAVRCVTQVCSHTELRLHVCLLSAGETADSKSCETVAALRRLAQAGRGRFHWSCDTGVVESEELRLLKEELTKCSTLVDSLSSSRRSTSPEEATLKHEKAAEPRATALSAARKARTHQLEERPGRTRPTIAVASRVPASKGGVWERRRLLLHKPVTRTLPRKEEICSSTQWLKKFGVQKLKLDLHKLASGPRCPHQDTSAPIGANASCATLPSVRINGEVRHLQMNAAELTLYITQAEQLLRRYAARIRWLLCGSRFMFGLILEKQVCVLVDTSGSMAASLAEVVTSLTALLWEQLHRRCRFTLLAFSSEVRLWRRTLVEASTENCEDAARWCSQLCAHGGTCTLQALQAACSLGHSLGCYLLTDGRADTSCSLLLTELQKMTAGKHIALHTVSFRCSDSTANEFLRQAAGQTGGRMHLYCGEMDSETEDFGEDVTSHPVFRGDDLRRLVQEMDKVRCFHLQAQDFRKVILEKQNLAVKQASNKP